MTLGIDLNYLEKNVLTQKLDGSNIKIIFVKPQLLGSGFVKTNPQIFGLFNCNDHEYKYIKKIFEQLYSSKNNYTTKESINILKYGDLEMWIQNDQIRTLYKNTNSHIDVISELKMTCLINQYKISKLELDEFPLLNKYNSETHNEIYTYTIASKDSIVQLQLTESIDINSAKHFEQNISIDLVINYNHADKKNILKHILTIVKLFGFKLAS